MPDMNSDGNLQLPEVTLTASGSGREVNLAGIGVPTVLVFHGQDTADTALEINKAVRAVHPGADTVFIASIIDLRSFPSMFHSMVKPAIEKAYFNAAGKVPEGTDPADLVVLLPDWDGSVHDAVGVTGSTDQAAVVIVDSEGRIIATDQTDHPTAAVLTALESLA